MERVSGMRGEWPSYSVYGIPFASDFAFRTPLIRTEVSPEIRFATTEAAIEVPVGAECRYASRRRTAEGRPVLTLYTASEGEYFVLPGGECFRWERERIEVFIPDPARTAIAEIFFLGTLLAYLLERRDIPVLHAATVQVEGMAAAFLAGNGGGKSSLAAAFLQAGFPLISDDLLPLRKDQGGYSALPGYPQIRFWPAEARHFGGEGRELARVHPDQEKLRLPVGSGELGTFRAQDAPLGAIYVPDRQATGDAPIEIMPVRATEAVAILAQQLFVAPLLHGLGLAGTRLQGFAALVGQVPVRRLRYPSGLEHLPAVVEAVRTDLERRR